MSDRRRKLEFEPHPVPAPDAGPYIRVVFTKPPNEGLVLLVTPEEWRLTMIRPTPKVLAARFREIGEGDSTGPPLRRDGIEFPGGLHEQRPPAPGRQVIELRAAAPLRGRAEQIDLADVDLFQGQLL